MPLSPAESPLQQPITTYIWREKYRHGEEADPQATFTRVAEGVYALDTDPDAKTLGLKAMKDRDWMPGGRIFAGAGTGKRVTWINCFVSPTIQDSMDTEPDQPGLGIMPTLSIGAYTQQMGGGIGMDFSPIRPAGAKVGRTGSVSSGVIPFMGMWDGMCGTIKSSGSRRGAMMGTLAIWHPDVIQFITAKKEKGKLENFNISVTVTDAFMEALEKDEDWELGHWIPRDDGSHLDVKQVMGRSWYVYKRLPAKDLWEMIIRNTYDWAEPGIIFIDRVNKLNNLNYCEIIAATNPCGEQPLPPDGDCDLGHANLANMVLNPFTDQAEIDWQRLAAAVATGVRFLDNVLDTSPFPTPAQAEEALSKRRIGLGYTGLGNLLQQMRVRYGSEESVILTEKIGEFIAFWAYSTSVDLARERGPFPLCDKEKLCKAPFIQKLPKALRDKIWKYGLRNGVLLTLAPTGTTSLFYGNTSSGIEPSFQWLSERDAVVEDRGAGDRPKKTFDVEDYGYFMYRVTMNNGVHPKVADLPPYFVTALELGVEEHLAVAAAAQKWIDAAISKTINCDKAMSYEDFESVYLKAYAMGMKGCTTYRPSDVRGSVLRVKEDKPTLSDAVVLRPAELTGKTYKLKWLPSQENIYLTVNDITEADGSTRPFEIFLNGASPKNAEWLAALTRTVSAVCRRGDAQFLFEELEKIHGTEGTFIGHEFTPSIVALIGRTLKQHTTRGRETKPSFEMEACPQCEEKKYLREQGCSTCQGCGYSKCG